MNQRPAETEYGEYFGRYVRLVPDGSILEILREQKTVLIDLLESVPEERETYRYAPGKWSLKEAFGHIIDTERIMSGRLLRIARGDQTPLPGFDQDLYVAGADFDSLPLAAFIRDFDAVRDASLTLLEHLPAAAWDRTGTANKAVLSTRALAYIIAGHTAHHISVIRDHYLA